MADDIDRVWELMKKISICMLASWDGHELHARPMGAYVRQEDDAIYFLTDARHHKDQDVARYPKVCLAFADTSGQKYVSLAGVAESLRRSRQDPRIVGDASKSVVGFRRRSQHQHSESNTRGRSVLGQPRHNPELRQHGSCRTDRIAPRHG